MTFFCARLSGPLNRKVLRNFPWKVIHIGPVFKRTNTNVQDARGFDCRDCPKKFPFIISGQTFYIQKMSTSHWPTRCSDCKSAKKKRFPQDDVALPIDAAAVVLAVDIDQTVDRFDEILHVDDGVLPEM